MNIVFVISSLGTGGAERTLTLIANSLSDKHRVKIITFSEVNPVYHINDNIEIVHLNLPNCSKSVFCWIISNIRKIFDLKKALNESKSDVNISFLIHTNIFTIIASKINGQKIIVSEDVEYNYYKNDKILFATRRIIYRLANHVVVKTFSDSKNYVFLDRVSVIKNPLPKLSSINHVQCIEKKPILFAAGRLEHQKGFDTLIRSYSKIRTSWKLYIAGEGNERKHLEEMIKKYSLEDRVILLGRIENIFDWYKMASIFVLSSRKEGFGNVLIEAMSMGCAVVSFDCPYGPGEIIEDGVNGILVEDQNEEKLREALERLIDDAELRHRLGEEAKKARENYSIEKIGGEWERLIREVAGDKSHRGQNR